MKKTALLVVIVLIILAALLAFAAPAYASASCTYNPRHGWHIVGGGESNDHWYDTEEECIAALAIITETPNSTEEVTETPIATEDVTETPVVTETPIATEAVTETPVVTETPAPTTTPVVTATPTEETIVTVVVNFVKGQGCQAAWNKIQNNKFKDVGYRYFDNPEHAWCQDWLRLKYGIDYNYYKLMNP